LGVYTDVRGLRRIAVSRRLSRLLVVALFGVAGCGSGSSVVLDRPGPPSLQRRCGESIKAELVWFKASDGSPLDGALIGSGPRGVVLAHGYPGDVCDMLGLGWHVARRGFRVLVFDFRGFGLSPRAEEHEAINHFSADLAGAADLLRERGAKKVFLVGWSFGGTAVAAAAPVLDPRPDGVVDISGPANLEFAFPGAEDMNALARASKLESPLLYLTARGDTRVPVPEARALVRRAPVNDKRLYVFAGDYHAGALLFESPDAQRVNRLLFDFLRTR
jgi:pimeloyl-ACP methyl ester carboxylesterase